jgi:4-aminobutyrate aminotransferase-like enzyme/Ser/Thr protein kinase RdoA (MazF antagonist)
MLALRTSAPAFSPSQGERIAREEYGLALEASALWGERDCNLRLDGADGSRFVLKILSEDIEPGAAARLASVFSHLTEVRPGLPVPRLIPTQHGNSLVTIHRDGATYYALLMDFLPGRHVQGLAPPALLRHVGATLAATDLGLQGFFDASLQRPLAWDLRQLPQLIEWAEYIEPPAARDAVRGAAQAMKMLLPTLRAFRSQAIHGDCHPGNLLVDGAGERVCGILDFGDMIHAPLIFEPAISMAEFLMEGLATADGVGAILQGFTTEQRPDAAEIATLFDLIAARHAVTLLIHAWRARHDAAAAAGIDPAAVGAWRSLQSLLMQGRDSLTAQWQALADAGPLPSSATAGQVDLKRRHRLLGAGAELFYDRPLHIVRGEGVWLYDAAGAKYLDVYNNVPHVGHGHPTVAAAIARQTAVLATHTRYLHPAILDYAEELIEGLPSGLDTCIFVNSGSEANDVAWRIAKMASGHSGALIMNHAYHGITDAVGALTPGAGAPAVPWVVALAAPPDGLARDDPMTSQQLSHTADDARRAIEVLRERGFAPAAWFIDSALTSSGILDPHPEWAAVIEPMVRAAGGLIVADEVQFGLGRSGSHFWSFERRGLAPDIVTLGKPLGNGYPMGIVIARRALIERFQREFGFFSTFGGNAVAASAGRAVLHVLREEGLMANALATGRYLRARLTELTARHRYLQQPRGSGLLQGLVVGGTDPRENTRQIVNRMAADHRVLIGAEGPQANVLKMRPPMCFSRQNADQLIAAIDAAAATLP